MNFQDQGCRAPAQQHLLNCLPFSSRNVVNEVVQFYASNACFGAMVEGCFAWRGSLLLEL